jgi:sigma-B regulation protein RsbU (phosphoserine phosphatase)
VQEGGFDLLISDWQMPGMDGVELLQKIRAREAGGHGYLYAILLTSRSEKSDLVEGMSSGADDFVSKPFDRDELRVRVQAAGRIIELEHALGEQNRRLAIANQILRSANQRMKESLEAAAKIQQSYLPENPPESPHAKFGWIYEPCDELAGDTLNVLPLTEELVGIYIVDVSGHGVPAALLSVHLSRIFTRRSASGSLLRGRGGSGGVHDVTPPAAVVAELNRRFALDGTVEQYFTALYGVLDLRKREFKFTSAGHPGPLVISVGGARRFRACPPAVGFLPDATFSEQTLQCDGGDRLYFYTDGVFEVENGEGEQFGEERLQEVLENAARDSLQKSLEDVRDAARAWCGEAPFVDDVSLIGVEITPAACRPTPSQH